MGMILRAPKAKRNTKFVLDAGMFCPHSPNMDKRAPQMIRDWLNQEGRKAGWLAAQVQADRSTVSQWLNGHRAPHPGARARLAAVTGLPVDNAEVW